MPARHRAPSRRARVSRPAHRPWTLVVDIGASHVKGALVDAVGHQRSRRFKVDTPSGGIGALLDAIESCIEPLPRFDRVSVGFPGIIADGVVYTAPNLDGDFHGLRLQRRLRSRLRRPVRLMNDAVMHGYGVVRGRGVEVIVTLGTGLGTALFLNGRPGPQLQLLPLDKDASVTPLGDDELDELGRRKWSKRVRGLIEELHRLTTFDRLFVGGGNAKKISGPLPHGARVVSNDVALRGGLRAWLVNRA